MDKEFTVTEHLDEMRKRIIASLIAVISATLISIPLASATLKFLKYPAAGLIDRLVFFGPEEAFMIYMKISFMLGLIIAFPVIMSQLWMFIAPAVEEKVKKYAAFFIFSSSLVFILGCLFSYFVLLPTALKFLLGLGVGELEPVISATRYISFVCGLMLACGLVFEMPVLSFFLTRINVINANVLRKKFKYALIAIAIAAAAITPTGDAFNMTMLALPMLALYEVSIWISYFAGKERVTR
jgi:sec-independent protein translocase protein TatC